MRPLALPWTGRDVPHAMLDINRGCNIRCRACYNLRQPGNRTLEQIERDLDDLLSLRRLQTLTICGGEPLLHPDVSEIVRRIRRRGLHAAMTTNGRNFDETSARILSEAGLDLILFHIDHDQSRDDLPDPHDGSHLRTLRHAKLQLAHAHGIAAGLISTAFSDRMDDAADTVQLALDLPFLRYLVFTGHVNFSQYGTISGSLRKGLAIHPGPHPTEPVIQTTNAVCARMMKERFSARPFAYLPSQGSLQYDAWLSYQAGVVYENGKATQAKFIESSGIERLGLRLLRRRDGRYPFFHEETHDSTRTQLMLNALTGGTFFRNARLLLHSNSRPLVMKHIVFQQGPTLDDNDTLSICHDCPDAVISNGQLLPVCLADRTQPPRTAR